MYDIGLQLLGVRDDSYRRAGVGLWTLTRMCSITQTDAIALSTIKYTTVVG